MSIQWPGYGNRMTRVVEARPATLYHYTNAAGLLGIVEKRALWATDVQFLNDGEELIYAAREISVHARSRAEEICPELSHEPKYDDAFGRAQRLCGIADGVDGHADGRYAQIFVGCFCRDGDLLSQWRGYGRDGGFALGFDSGTLASSAEMVDGRLERIRYGLEAIDQLIQKIENLPPTGFPGANGWAYTRDHVLPWLARVKSPAFHEEQEWRVIVEALDGGHRGMKFRTSDYGLVPYISLSFSPKALRKVVVGPGAHPSLREAGVKKLLRASGFEGVEITTSAISNSYRSRS
jgi:hypothetical protein